MSLEENMIPLFQTCLSKYIRRATFMKIWRCVLFLTFYFEVDGVCVFYNILTSNWRIDAIDWFWFCRSGCFLVHYIRYHQISSDHPSLLLPPSGSPAITIILIMDLNTYMVPQWGGDIVHVREWTGEKFVNINSVFSKSTKWPQISVLCIQMYAKI